MALLLAPEHELCAGSIGVGKSRSNEYKVIQSFEYDRPCTYIDPKSDSYYAILAYLYAHPALWEKYKHRIIFLNPVAPTDHMVAFNAIDPLGDFYHANPDKIALVANSLVAHIKKGLGWEGLGTANRMEAIMSASIALLVNGKYTLAEMPALFLQTYQPGDKGKTIADKFNPFTAQLLEGFDHPSRMWWHYSYGNWTVNDRKQFTTSTDNQIFSYFTDQRALYTTCAKDNQTLDFRKLVADRCWLFVNLPYQFLGETLTSLIGNLIITNIFYACMQREPTHDTRLILDEARFFAGGPLDVIFNTSRHFRLWITLIVQSLEQTCRSREGGTDYYLRDTILNTTRYFSIFHNVLDAKTFAELMFPLTAEPLTITPDGDWQGTPTPMVLDRNRRRFMNLQKREVIFWDKYGGPARRRRTADFDIPEVPMSVLTRFEAEHLRNIGRPIAAIQQEIAEREAYVQELIHSKRTPRKSEDNQNDRGNIPQYRPGGAA